MYPLPFGISSFFQLLCTGFPQFILWIRRALFGQSLVDFSGSNWSSIELHKSVSECQPICRSKKTVPKMVQEFSQAGLDTAPNLADKEQFPSLVPGMSSYESQESQESQDVDMDVGNVPGSKSLSTTAVHFDIFSQASDVESESEESVHSTSKTFC